MLNITIERSMKIENEHGLHMRAAAMVARTACEFISDIKICYKSKTVDGKSTFGLLTLGAPHAGTIRVQANGYDAAPALEAIYSLLQEDDFINQSAA